MSKESAGGSDDRALGHHAGVSEEPSVLSNAGVEGSPPDFPSGGTLSVAGMVGPDGLGVQERRGPFPRWDFSGLTIWIDAKSIKAAFRHCLSLPTSVLVSSFFINFLGLALPLVILQIYDRILPNKALGTLGLLMFGLVVVVFIESAMKIARAQVMSWAALKKGFAVDLEAVNRILRAKDSEIAKDSASVWIDRLDALTELNGFYGGPARLILLDLPFVLIFLTVIALVGGPLVLVPLAVVACFAGHTALRGKKLQALLQDRSEQDRRRYDFIVECLSGIGSIKSMAMEPQMQRRFERLQQSAAEVSFKVILHGSHMQSIGSMFANVSMVSMVTIGALAVMSGHLSIGALACCTLLSGRVVQPVLRGIAVWSELQNVAICHERAAPLFSLPAYDVQDVPQADIKGAITIRNFSCERKEDGELLFDNLSLSVGPGQIAGIRGADGSGRSFLLKVIRGEFVPEEGSVHIDGWNSSSPAYRGVAKSICYVGAGSPIFRGSVIENLTMFRTGEALERARDAARLIGLEDDIHALPEGYDTKIGEGVVDTLPEGLQQRIAIARAIAQGPKILLFDEANSMVDFESDSKLREGLKKIKGKMTILLISNRPSLLAISDAIYELSDGHLVPVQANGSPIGNDASLEPHNQSA